MPENCTLAMKFALSAADCALFKNLPSRDIEGVSERLTDGLPQRVGGKVFGSDRFTLSST